MLTYGAASSKSGVVTATVTNGSVKLVPAGLGAATVTVTATDAPGSNASARQQFAVTVRNDAPEAVGTIAAPLLQVGDGARTVDVSGAFRDPDLDVLVHAAWPDELAILGVAVSGSTLSLTPKRRGAASVTVDGDGFLGIDRSGPSDLRRPGQGQAGRVPVEVESERRRGRACELRRRADVRADGNGDG